MVSNPSVFARSLHLQAGWEQALTERLTARHGTRAQGPTPRLFAATALAIMRASLQHWLTVPNTPALPTLVQSGFDQLASGLGAD
jgi:hypothetical protein